MMYNIRKDQKRGKRIKAERPVKRERRLSRGQMMAARLENSGCIPHVGAQP